VLDPFCGSGTTAAAAYQLDRNYVGIEISPEYVGKANERLAELNNPILNFKFQISNSDIAELKRLLADMGKPAKEIASDKKLIKLFTKQFLVRTNNEKKYTTEQILTVIKEFQI
jgi:SAM-dependent methyltransferase